MMKMSCMLATHVNIIWILFRTTLFFWNFIIRRYGYNFYYQYIEHIYYIHVQFINFCIVTTVIMFIIQSKAIFVNINYTKNYLGIYFTMYLVFT